jgi:two-component system chemotaxis response regulator CheY
VPRCAAGRQRGVTTILIADDDLDMRTLVRMAIELANDGLEVVGEAADGLEALDVWRDLDGPPTPDVIILDNRMPGLTGIEVAQKILAERPDQIVVLYTAFLDKAVQAEAAVVGITACVSKDEHHRLPDLVRHLAS